MCDNLLLLMEGGVECPSCASDNPKGARFCRQCGSPFDPGAVALPTAAEMAGRVLDAVGGVGVGVGAGAATSYEEEGEFAETGAESLVGESMSDVEDDDQFGPGMEPPPPTAVKAPVGAVADEELPGPILETPPATEIEPDEDFAPPPPPGVVETAPEPAAPTAPPAEIEADEDFGPPPPPGVVETTEEDFAPPPPPGALEVEEEGFAPPPPPGVVETTPEDAELPPIPTAEEAAQTPTKGAAEGEKDDTAEFGDWSLDFDEKDE